MNKGLVKLGTLAFVLMIGLATTSILTSCATTGTTTTGNAGAAGEDAGLTAEELARQKAIQDSIFNVNKIEFMKTFSTGHEYYKQKNYDNAIPHFKEAIGLIDNPTFAAKIDSAFSGAGTRTYREYALSFSNIGSADSAKIVFEKAVDKYPNNAYFRRSAAYYQSASNETEQAIENYYKAIELDGETLGDYKNLGQLLIKADRQEEALEVYEDYIEMNPNDSAAQNTYAVLLENVSGDPMAVIEAKERALKADPENANLKFEIARMYFRQQYYKEAAAMFERYLEQNPEDVGALEYYGSALQNAGQFEDAIAVYEKALALQPDAVKIMCEMSTSYRELENYRKAYSFANQAIRTDSDFGLGYIVKGEVYEAVADDCIGQREERVAKFDDKLVYLKATELYEQAFSDVEWGNYARQKARSLSTMIPTKQDYFMFPDKDKPELDCYSWLAF